MNVYTLAELKPEAGRLLRDEPSPMKDVAVTTPTTLTPVEFIVTADPTVISLVTAKSPVTFNPALKEGAPVPAWLVKLSARTLPPDPPNGVTPSVDSPRTSGIKSSPS